MKKWFIAVCMALVATGIISTAASAAPEDKVKIKVMNPAFPNELYQGDTNPYGYWVYKCSLL